MEIKLLYAQGRAYQNKKSAEAIGKFKECLNLINENKNNELYLSSLFHLSKNQQIQKQYSNAIESLSKILQSDCNDKCVYEERGKNYLFNENYDKALRDFETLAEFDENYAPSLEAAYYKDIFINHFGIDKVNILEHYWQPKWINKDNSYVDPSARTLNVY